MRSLSSSSSHAVTDDTTTTVIVKKHRKTVVKHARNHDDDDDYDNHVDATMHNPISSSQLRRPKTRQRISRRNSIIIVGSIFVLMEFFLMTMWSHQMAPFVDMGQMLTSPLSLSLPSADSNNNKYGHVQERRRIRRRRPDRDPDGHFNGYPVYYHDLTQNTSYHSRPYSAVRCVGENYQGTDRAWTQRSCHFRFICFNLSSHEFEVYQRPDDLNIQHHLSAAASRQQQQQQQRWSTTTDFMDMTSSVLLDRNVSSVSIGGLGTDFDDPQYRNLRWFPTIISSQPPERYYALEEDLVMVPFHSLSDDDHYFNDDNSSNEASTRHQPYRHSVLWDDFLPIYTLLSIFQFVTPNLGGGYGYGIGNNNNNGDDEWYTYYDENHREALIMRYTLSPEHRSHSRHQSSSSRCESSTDANNNNNSDDCWTSSSSVMDKFLPLMMYDHSRRHHHHGQSSTSRHNGTKKQQRQHQRSIDSTVISTQYDAVLRLVTSSSESSGIGTEERQRQQQQSQQQLQSNLVCAKDGVAGVGPLTSHGLKKSKYQYLTKRRRWMYDQHSHNHGRGIVLWWFRNYCLYNLGFALQHDNHNDNIPLVNDTTTYGQHRDMAQQSNLGSRHIRIVFSTSTTSTITNNNNKRFMDLNSYEQILKDEYRNDPWVQIESHNVLDNTTLVEHIQLVLESTIFVITCGSYDSDVSMVTFLPRGSTLVVFYSVEDNVTDVASTKKGATPTCQEWDLINNMSYLRVHWLPTPTSPKTTKDDERLKSFSTLIRHEIFIHKREFHSGPVTIVNKDYK